MKINFKKLHPDAIEPKPAHQGDAGYDLCSVETTSLAPGEHKVIQSGIAIEIPSGIEIQVRPRSGLAAKHGITVLNAPGTIDSGYRGEIGVILMNLGKDAFEVEKGMRIAQLVFHEYIAPELQETDELDETERGAKGYGSSGTK